MIWKNLEFSSYSLKLELNLYGLIKFSYIVFKVETKF